MGPRAEAVAIARKAFYCYGNCVNRMDEGFPIFMFLEVHRNIIIAPFNAFSRSYKRLVEHSDGCRESLSIRSQLISSFVNHKSLLARTNRDSYTVQSI